MNIEDEDTTVSSKPIPAARPRVRILLVDDNADFRRLAARFLDGQPGCEVVAFATSGAEAVDLARRIRPDLVLMDLSMPGMNGFEAARRIKRSPEAPRVVIVTLDGSAPYRAASESALADDFMSKGEFIHAIGPVVEKLFPHAFGRIGEQSS